MPKFQMTYPYPRQFVDGLSAEPGEVIEADVNPDPNFFVEVDGASVPVEAPAAVEAEPASSDPEAPTN